MKFLFTLLLILFACSALFPLCLFSFVHLFMEIVHHLHFQKMMAVEPILWILAYLLNSLNFSKQDSWVYWLLFWRPFQRYVCGFFSWYEKIQLVKIPNKTMLYIPLSHNCIHNCLCIKMSSVVSKDWL